MIDPSSSFQQALRQKGLPLYAVLMPDTLPDDVLLGAQSPEGARLLVLGNGGSRLWQYLLDQQWDSAEPLDDFTRAVVDREIDHHLGGAKRQWVYPVGGQINLLAIGRLLHWFKPSPMGMGINADWGMWSAFRAALWVHYPLAVTEFAGDWISPCEACDAAPCLAACPAEALSREAMPELERCASFRVHTAHGACEDRCVARMVCPVQREHQYPLSQIQHHYGRALESDTFRSYALPSPSPTTEDSRD